MKKQIKIIFFGLILLVITGFILYFYFAIHNHYQRGDKENIKIGVGDSFTIKINENGSTGSSNCWINQNKCNFVISAKKQYEPHWFSQNLEGSGGTMSWTFTGTALGTDTIKIANCPTGRLHKDCNYFSADTLQLSNDSVVTTFEPYIQADYTFIVTVTD